MISTYPPVSRRSGLLSATAAFALMLGVGAPDSASAQIARVSSKTVTDNTTFTVPYATNGRTRTWTYTWNATGQLLTVDGPLPGTGDTITYTYSSGGYLASVKNEVGQTTTVTAWSARGQPTSVTDPNGTVTTMTYDIDGNLLTMTINPGAAQSQYSFTYDEVGDLTKLTLPLGGYLVYTYDDARRVTLVTNDRGQTQAFGYDAMSDRTSSVIKTSGGTIVAQQTFAYDELGRVIQAIGAGSQTTGFGYDKVDNLTNVTDARGKLFQNAFDPLNRIITQTNPESQSTQTAYDTQDNLTSFKDGRSLQTARTVDGFGQIIQEVSPDRGTRSYWYDAAGRLTKQIDGDGIETDFTYDNAGRRLTATFPSGMAENITYTYDAALGGNKGVGRLTSITDQTGSTALFYDAQGRIGKDTKIIQGKTYATIYAYDANGKVTTETLPSGRTVTYTRATDGLITGVYTKLGTGALQTLASSVTYLPFGPLATLTYGNGLVLTRSFDQNYWMSRIQVKSGSIVPLDISLGRNANGQLTSVTDNGSSGRAATYDYTDSGRLKLGNGPWGNETYTWDAAGNRISKVNVLSGVTTTANVTTATASNKLVKIADAVGTTTRTFTFRIGGDLSQDVQGSTTYVYSYNARKRLIQATSNGTVVGKYGYDAAEHRVWRQTFSPSTTTTHYVYSEDGKLLAEHDASTGAVKREYVWVDDTPLAVIDSTGSSPAIYYIHAGPIDEPLAMTDATKSTAWSAYVEPFGAARLFGVGTANLDLRLPGQQLQAETGGLHQNWFRDYDSGLGRYSQSDMLEMDPSGSVYSYASGSPLQLFDPTGLDAVVLDNSGAVVGAGHVGIIVGNASSGWEYFSKNGYGPGNYSDIHFDTLDRALESSALSRYDVRVLIHTTQSQDARMTAAGHSLVKSKYSLFDRNCTRLVEDILRSGGVPFQPGKDQGPPLIPNTLTSGLQSLYSGAQ